MKTHEVFSVLFGNKHLSVDILMRFAILHYGTGFLLIQVLTIHLAFVHDEWDSNIDNTSQQEASGTFLH